MQGFLQSFIGNPTQDLDKFLSGIQGFYDTPAAAVIDGPATLRAVTRVAARAPRWFRRRCAPPAP